MTERVPGCNLRIIPNFPLPAPSQARCSLASSPIGGAKGGCAAGGRTVLPSAMGGCAAEFPPSYPLRRQIFNAEISMRWAGKARPLALPLGELARRKP